MLHLACLKGNIGFWTFYSTIVKIKDLVEENRIITVSESEELYTKNINRVLQREIKQKRIKQISKYINETDERFFNSLVVAIHEGNPKWTDIDVERSIKIEDQLIDDTNLDILSNKYGILSLNGDEEIFALDGQHRLRGLRKAYKDDPEIGEKELSLIFVIHNHDQVERTRRLFTVLNKYAEKPRGAELIIIDEDDAAAINTRRLVSDHQILSIDNALSDSKTANIIKSDTTSFTTLVNLNRINKTLYDKKKAFYQFRPSDEELDNLYNASCTFWDNFFETFPELINFINSEDAQINGKPITRDSENGGSLLLRPVGQKLIAQAYNEFDEGDKMEFWDKLREIDFTLSGEIWKYLFWNDGKMIGKELRLKRNLLLYILGKFDDTEYINAEMTRIYDSFNINYNNHIDPV